VVRYGDCYSKRQGWTGHCGNAAVRSLFKTFNKKSEVFSKNTRIIEVIFREMKANKKSEDSLKIMRLFEDIFIEIEAFLK
jgi:hypothetical protein